MARAPRAPIGISAGVVVWLLCALGFQGIEAGPSAAPPGGATCRERFTARVPDFVLDINASVSHGATSWGSRTVTHSWDCVLACCETQNCNLALVELQPGGGADAVAACFLMDCLYEHNFVCKFAPKEGFVNYLSQEVYSSYRDTRLQGLGGKEEEPEAQRAAGLGCGVHGRRTSRRS